MSLNLARIEAHLREKICPSCVRFTASRMCSLPASRPCAIFKNLPAIVDIVRRVHSNAVDPYVDAVRLNVCAVCHFEDNHGACPMRAGLDCALDTYLPIIINEVETEFTNMRREQISKCSG